MTLPDATVAQEGPLEALISLDAVPFLIGMSDRPHNPSPFPDVLPMHLGLEISTGLVKQMPAPEVRRYLALAYDRGSLLGTAMDDTASGRGYASDFLAFLGEETSLSGLSVLEIGAGRGYLLKLLRECQAKVLGIEPGRVNMPYWAANDVPVVVDFFPSRQVESHFDLIVAYAVLEHIEAIERFLADIARQLKPGGSVALAVPDCSAYIADGDPGMLLHEHWNYFTPSTLDAVLRRAGFKVKRLRAAKHGSVIYVIATLSDASSPPPMAEHEIASARDFARHCNKLRVCVSDRLSRFSKEGRSLGIYVPGRALMWPNPGRASVSLTMIPNCVVGIFLRSMYPSKTGAIYWRGLSMSCGFFRAASASALKRL